jgi:general secretion pathway protein C
MLEILPVGSKVRASLSPPVGELRSAAPGAPQAAVASSPPAGEIRVNRLADNRYSIDEAGVAQLSGNINQFMTQVRLIPFFEGNKSAGYRIAAIRPGTTFEQLGFQGGDVLQQVNGLDLSSPEKLYTIFQNLKDEKKVSVNILRQGNKNTLTYEIR